MITFTNSILLVFLACGMHLYAENAQPTNKKNDDLRTKRVQIATLTDEEKKHIVDQLFEPSEKKQTSASPVILSDQAIIDLQILSSGHPQDNLLAVFEKPKTTFGNHALGHLLTHPTTDTAILIKRQQAVEFLCQHPEIVQEIEQQLLEISKAENLFLNLWKEKDEISKKIINEVYFGAKLNRLNTSPFALELLRQATYLYQSLGFVPPLWILEIGPLLMANIQERTASKQKIVNANMLTIPFKALYNAFKKAFKDHNLTCINEAATTAVKNFQIAEQEGIAFIKIEERKAIDLIKEHKDLKLIDEQQAIAFIQIEEQKALDLKQKAQLPGLVKSKNFFKTIHIGLTLLQDAWWAWRAKEATKNVLFYNYIYDVLYQQTMSTAIITRAMHKLHAIIAAHPQLASAWQYADALREFCPTATHADASCTKLISLLHSNTFRGKPTQFAIMGRVLATYQLMNQHKDVFIPGLQSIGEIAAYIATVKTITQAKSQQKPFCSVTFAQQSVPNVELTDVWNPLLTNPVFNTIIMGGSAQRHILLTGPHGTGKSVCMKSVAYALVLGQTFGVAPASKAIFTPFAHIETYLNVKEDVAKNLSTFMAEEYRLRELDQLLSKNNSTEFCFAILDEVFKGTMEAIGSKLLYEFGERLITYPYALSMIATHFESVTKLEELSKGIIKNYHMGLMRIAPEVFNRTFELIPGINPWWFTDEKKQSEFLAWLKKQTV